MFKQEAALICMYFFRRSFLSNNTSFLHLHIQAPLAQPSAPVQVWLHVDSHIAAAAAGPATGFTVVDGNSNDLAVWQVPEQWTWVSGSGSSHHCPLHNMVASYALHAVSSHRDLLAALEMLMNILFILSSMLLCMMYVGGPHLPATNAGDDRRMMTAVHLQQHISLLTPLIPLH